MVRSDAPDRIALKPILQPRSAPQARAAIIEGDHEPKLDHQTAVMASKETHSSGAPIQPASKSTKVDPQVNSDLELGSLPNGNGNGNGKGDGEVDTDIMQIARVGDIPAMEALFETKEYDATYADEEGITALHVCMPVPAARHTRHASGTFELTSPPLSSGPRSTTSTPCASSSSTAAPR